MSRTLQRNATSAPIHSHDRGNMPQPVTVDHRYSDRSDLSSPSTPVIAIPAHRLHRRAHCLSPPSNAVSPTTPRPFVAADLPPRLQPLPSTILTNRAAGHNLRTRRNR